MNITEAEAAAARRVLQTNYEEPQEFYENDTTIHCIEFDYMDKLELPDTTGLDGSWVVSYISGGHYSEDRHIELSFICSKKTINPDYEGEIRKFKLIQDEKGKAKALIDEYDKQQKERKEREMLRFLKEKYESNGNGTGD